jgi:hypothetical protein
MNLDERLKAHAADFAACWRDFEIASRGKRDGGDDFRFDAEGFCLAVLSDPEGWGWIVGRVGDDGKISVIINAPTYVDEAREALQFGWCALVAVLCGADAGVPPDLTEEHDGLKAHALLVNAFAAQALEAYKGPMQ